MPPILPPHDHVPLLDTGLQERLKVQYDIIYYTHWLLGFMALNAVIQCDGKVVDGLQKCDSRVFPLMHIKINVESQS